MIDTSYEVSFSGLLKTAFKPFSSTLIKESLTSTVQQSDMLIPSQIELLKDQKNQQKDLLRYDLNRKNL